MPAYCLHIRVMHSIYDMVAQPAGKAWSRYSEKVQGRLTEVRVHNCAILCGGCAHGPVSPDLVVRAERYEPCT